MKPSQRFEFIAGSPALCFVDTLGDRDGAGRERLEDPRSLCDWLAAAGLLADRPCVATEQQLTEARALREAIHRCGVGAIRGEAFDPIDVATINRAAARPPLRPQLRDGTLVQAGQEPVRAALSVLAADALHLFASPLGRRIRRCPGCAMMFVDRSRPGRRRWCSSAQGCGNRAKVREARARRAGKERKVGT